MVIDISYQHFCSIQISGIKNINPSQDPSKPSRYRLSLVDGQATIQGMLATQLNEFAENGSLSEGSIVQLSEFITQTLNNQQILVLLNLSIVGRDDTVAGNQGNLFVLLSMHITLTHIYYICYCSPSCSATSSSNSSCE